MTGNIFKYSAVITKMRAMYKGILTETQYDNLLSLNRVHDIINYLKSTKGYGSGLEGIDRSDLHRSDIEAALNKSLLNDVYKLSLFLSKREKMMLYVLMSHMDIAMLKQIIRGIYTGTHPEGRSIYTTGFSGKHFDPSKCMLATTFNELLDALQGTPYEKILMPYVIKGEINTFDIEQALDEYYYAMLVEGSHKYLTHGDLKSFHTFFATEIDVYNILWIYRYKKYYDFTLEETMSHLIPNKYKLRRDKLVEIVECTIADFERVVARTRYGALFENSKDAEWDRRVSSFLRTMYIKQLRADKQSFVTLAAFLYLKEIDIRNITTVIEGVRYRMDKADIKKYLIL